MTSVKSTFCLIDAAPAIRETSYFCIVNIISFKVLSSANAQCNSLWRLSRWFCKKSAFVCFAAIHWRLINIFTNIHRTVDGRFWWTLFIQFEIEITDQKLGQSYLVYYIYRSSEKCLYADSDSWALFRNNVMMMMMNKRIQRKTKI